MFCLAGGHDFEQKLAKSRYNYLIKGEKWSLLGRVIRSLGEG
jgi:hypothetical protein